MPAKLTTDQNRILYRLVKLLIKKYGNASEAARVTGLSQTWMSKMENEIGGGSLESASIVCADLGLDVSTELRLAKTPASWSELPGYESALAEAQATLHHIKDEQVWAQVGRMIMPPNPAKVESWMLVSVAQLAAALHAQATTPPPKKLKPPGRE